jgi:hypothetical protein
MQTDSTQKNAGQEHAHTRVRAKSGTFEYNGYNVDLWRHLAGEPKEQVVTVTPQTDDKLDETDHPLMAALFRSKRPKAR